MRRLVALVIVVTLASPSLGFAQNGESQPRPIDPAKLGVSLDRIRRGLAVAESRETMIMNGQKLTVRVEVFGQAPPIDLLGDKEFSFMYGPVPRSAPTHREFIDFVTPQEFKAPAVPIYGLAIWAAQKLSERAKKSRCEQEVEEYRRLVMQGIAVAAPRCTQ